METKNSWKPQVGKTAWLMAGNTCMEVPVSRVLYNLVWVETQGRGDVKVASELLFPTPEAALASIKVFDLEGKEVALPAAEQKCPRIEPSPLVWVEKTYVHHFADGSTEIQAYEKTASDGCFKYSVTRDGSARFARKNQRTNSTQIVGYVTCGSFATGMAAVHEWRFAHINGMVKKEVQVARAGAETIHFIGVCSECKKEMRLDSPADSALGKIANLASQMDFPSNPEGAARLKAAQGRFAKLGDSMVNNHPIKWQLGMVGYITTDHSPVLQVVPNMATGKLSCFIGDTQLAEEFMLPDSALDYVEREFLKTKAKEDMA